MLVLEVCLRFRPVGADTPIIMGRIIPREDIPVLKAMGVREIFGPGTHTGEIVAYLQEELA